MPKNQLWQQGIFDFALSQYLIEAEAGQWLSSSRIQFAAHSVAQQNHHAGYAFALCSAQKAWIVTTPSPATPATRNKESLLFSLTAARAACRSIAVDFASQHSSKTRSIIQHRLDATQSSSWLHINDSFLDSGFISLTCLPKQGELGPSTWAMVPTTDISKTTFQGPTHLQSTQPSDFAGWLNQLRAKTGLSSVQLSAKLLHQAAATLARQNHTVQHHRPQLRRVRQILDQNGFRLIGENRVRAATPSELAWLLWNSPRHRNLLLSPKATHIGISSQKIGQEYLVVLVMSEQTKALTQPSAPLVRRQSQPAKTL